MRSIQYLLIFGMFLGLAGVSGCKKTGIGDDGTGGGVGQRLDYGDSILFLHNHAGDHIQFPTQNIPGRYFSFPEGLQLNSITGEINVTQSESGLRYKVYLIPEGRNDTLSTTVLVSGINYFDKIYNLSMHDTIAPAIYNGSISRTIPGGSQFDVGNGCNALGCNVQTLNGSINLKQTIRNGVFGGSYIPQNGTSKEFDLIYKINDASDKSTNKIRIKLYYYNTAADMDQSLVDLLNDRIGTVFGTIPAGTSAGSAAARIARPRPPCIIIVGH